MALNTQVMDIFFLFVLAVVSPTVFDSLIPDETVVRLRFNAKPAIASNQIKNRVLLVPPCKKAITTLPTTDSVVSTRPVSKHQSNRSVGDLFRIVYHVLFVFFRNELEYAFAVEYTALDPRSQ